MTDKIDHEQMLNVYRAAKKVCEEYPWTGPGCFQDLHKAIKPPSPLPIDNELDSLYRGGTRDADSGRILHFRGLQKVYASALRLASGFAEDSNPHELDRLADEMEQR